MKSFEIYISKLNPKCEEIFQKPKKSPSLLDKVWYSNKQVGHNTLGSMMSTISEMADLSVRYTNHCLRATAVHLLDSAQFAGRHIMTITGHKSETSLKTYTVFTDEKTKRKMSNTLSSNCGLIVQNNDQTGQVEPVYAEAMISPPQISNNSIQSANANVAMIPFPQNNIENSIQSPNSEAPMISLPQHIQTQNEFSLCNNFLQSGNYYPYITNSSVTINYNFNK